MRYLVRHVVILALVVAGLWAATSWPRLSEVETGRTPEYPELRVHDYGASETKVVEGLKAAIARLPRWRLVGVGQGPAGAELRAEHELPIVRLAQQVTVRVKREGGRTRVSVRSRSSTPWDFGQNARNIQLLFGELDRSVF